MLISGLSCTDLSIYGVYLFFKRWWFGPPTSLSEKNPAAGSFTSPEKSIYGDVVRGVRSGGRILQVDGAAF